MGKFSTYRYLELKDDTSSTSHINTRTRTIKQPRRLRKIFILLIVLALCVMYLMGLFANRSRFFDGIANSLGYQNDYHYAVIIDAGSSGSRVLAYKFRVPFTVFGVAGLDLMEEHFEESKPGLSSYADEPHKGADTIVQLIQKAEFLIPKEKRKFTPILVRATAGLRLLPTKKANDLIQSVKDAISGLGYDVGSNSVEIMDGSDEGIYIWYTVNLLHDLLDGETMAALDLGGGSTQITYQIGDSDEVASGDHYIVPTGSYNISVYTHSFLNLGLYAARHGIFKMEADENNSTQITSKCVDPIIQNEVWTYANKQYVISGRPRPSGQKRAVSYRACHELVREYVLRTMGGVSTRSPKGSVAAMSFYYEVAADAGIIDVMRGGLVTVAQYRTAAFRECSASNIEQPWACIDLTYIATLLGDALKIRDDEKISLYKKVNGHEVSWALGLAYTTMMNRII